MSDSKGSPKTPEEVQKEIQDFFKEKLGTDVFAVPIGATASPPPPEARPSPEDDDKPPDAVLKFNMTPVQVKAHLDRFVIGQEEAKRALAVAVCDHYNHVRKSLLARGRPGEDDSLAEYVKQNVVLLGPTGVGKTYLIRILAQLIGVPFVKADITKFSETGYVGGDVDDLVRELVRIADGDQRLAAHGIIFLDEIDKIASAPTSTGRDPSGRGVQVGLLKLMEDTDVSLRSPMDLGAQFQDLMQMRRGTVGKRTLNTRHILFVVSGAFSGLHEIVEKRLSERNIGFAAATAERDDQHEGEGARRNLLSRVTTKDFMEYGFEPEFIGRLPIRVPLDELSTDDLYNILTTSEGSILNQYRENFRGYGIEVSFQNDALEAIAKRAYEEATGARGLMTVLEACLRDFKFHLPGGEVKRLGVRREVVEDPKRALQGVLNDAQKSERDYVAAAVNEFEAEFEREHRVRLRLDVAAVDMAGSVADQLKIDLKRFLRETFTPHAPFLRKIAKQTDRSVLPVTPQILSRPGEGIDLWLGGSAASGA